jgi:hypothetical protein
MAEKFQRLKFDREIDAIEWTKEPEAYTFKPVILGDKRGGMSDSKRQFRPQTAPIEPRAPPKDKLSENKPDLSREPDIQKRKTAIAKNENLIEEDVKG